jgi:hypothetical protein
MAADEDDTVSLSGCHCSIYPQVRDRDPGARRKVAAVIRDDRDEVLAFQLEGVSPQQLAIGLFGCVRPSNHSWRSVGLSAHCPLSRACADIRALPD